MDELNENAHQKLLKNSKYSVLMSVYYKDNPCYLDLAIKSILNQSIMPDQIVIVVDGILTQELMLVLKKYSSNDMFLIVYLEENVGLANALNYGIKHCRNNLIARMDADDISLSTRCEKELLMFIQHSDLAVCGCNIGEFSEDIREIKTYRLVPSSYTDIKKFSRKRQPFNHPTVMYKKNVVEKIGGYSNLTRKEDFDLFSKIIASGEYVANIDEVLYLYRANKDNYKRRKSKENLLAAFKVYRAHRKRGACNMVDYLEICLAEVVLFLLPYSLMKQISDILLRSKSP